MTRNGRKINSKRAIASLLTGAFVLQQATFVGALAAVTSTNITGVTGNNGVYNINPQDIYNKMGYRNYTDFELKNGDIANLLFGENMNTFVNLVDNQIKIDGIVNTMKGSNFYNGKAVFVSPNGMVVGASGVLNVGSLGVYTPNAHSYNSMKNIHNDSGAAQLFGKDDEFYNTGKIEINGKVLSVGDVVLKGHTVNIGQNGGIVAGINESKMVLTKDAADALFTSLVNGTYASATGFSNNNGVITIETAPAETAISGSGINIAGHVYNNAQNGTVNILNTTGDLNVTSTGQIRNNGTTNIENYGFETLMNVSDGTQIRMGDRNTQLNLQGKIDTTGELNITNEGTKGANIGGRIDHNGTINIQNGYDLTSSIAGERNPEIKALNISANITNTQGNTNITNYAGGGLNISAGTINNQNGNLTLLNTGAGGLKTAGTITNNGIATVTNKGGDMVIDGSFSNNGNTTFLNDEGAGAFTVNGKVINTGEGSKLVMTNNGTGAFTTNNDSQINANGLEMTNNGSEFVINGKIDSRNISKYTNNNGTFTIGGNITNNSDSYLTNNGTDFNIGGTIRNTSGTANFTNNGSGKMEFSGTVNNVGNTYVINSNNSGKLIVGGNFTNNGVTGITNYGEALDVTGTITNTNNKLTITNHNGVFTTHEGSKIDAQGLRMENNGTGLAINGTIVNSTNGDYINNNGSFTTGANSNIQNKSGVANFENNGNGAMTFGGTIINTGTTTVTNSDNSGLLTVGGNFTNTGVTTMTNEGDGFDVTGNITNRNGKLTLSNKKGAFNAKAGSVIDTNKDITITNTGDGGLTTAGSITNIGTATVTNNAGTMNIGGTFTNTGVTTMTNEGDGFNVTGSITNRDGKLTLSNKKGAFNAKAGSVIDTNKDITITNTGDGGLTTAGSITNIGTATVTNNAGAMNIGGTFTNTGNANFLNNTGATAFNVNGTVTNSNGKLTMENKGSKAFTATNTSHINANGFELNNHGAGGMNLNGEIVNNGQAEITNYKDNLAFGGTFEGHGVTNVTNSNTANALNVTGNISNDTDKLTITNNGTGAFTTSETSRITANGLRMENNGAEFTMNGTVNNTGVGDYINNKGNFNLGGNVTNNGNGNYTNNENAGNFNVNGTLKNTSGNAVFTNNAAGTMTFSGTVENTGTTTVTNSDKSGLLTVGGNFTNTGVTTMTNNGEGFNVTGNVTNKGNKLTMTNNKGNFNVKSSGQVNAQKDIDMVNNTGALAINGTVNGTGTINVTNNGDNGLTVNGFVNGTGTTNVTNNGDNGLIVNGFVNGTGTTNVINNGADGLAVSGTIDGTGTTIVKNTKGDLKINNGGKINNRNGKLSILNTNKNGGLYVYGGGKVHNENNNTLISNVGDKGLHIEGTVENGGVLDITNEGADAINVSGNIHSIGDITMTNTGSKGVRIASTGQINGDNNILINNTVTKTETSRTTGAVNVEGVVNAKGNLTVNSTNGNIALGHKDTQNNLTAGKNIDLTVVDGSVLNNGVEKVLVKADGNLTMDVTNGTIGEAVQQNGLTNSTGIGPKAQGARDFTKSINANVAGNVTAETKDLAKTGSDLVINYAAIDSDMNINTIKADGRVILTVDDNFGTSNTEARNHKYSMVNANTEGGTNVEGWGISLIADNNIGAKDNMITFVQTKADTHKMDALANNSIYLKENSFNAYGRDGEVTKNSVSTMIAREGDMYVEFAGDTTIDNITAEGDMTVITRGKNLEIENLGHIQDDFVTPADYFGPRHDGYEFDGRNDGQYKSDVLPNNVTVKALDINHNIRPTEETLEGGHEAWANSTVRIKNAVVDNGKMEITADNVYANGIYAGFNKDGFTKTKDESTNKITGVVDPDSFNIPVGKAVRPDDVTGIGRGETERNYYYPAGDGDVTINDNPTTVDPDDGIVDGTPLVIVDKPGDNPIRPDQPDKQDGQITWKKVDDNDVEAIDKRQYMRFGIANNEHPVLLEKTNNGIDELLDVSRGGIAVTHSNKLKVGDVIPVHLTYADLDIKADVKVVTASTTRAGASFINLDKATANKLLYLNILLEDNNTISFR